MAPKKKTTKKTSPAPRKKVATFNAPSVFDDDPEVKAILEKAEITEQAIPIVEVRETKKTKVVDKYKRFDIGDPGFCHPIDHVPADYMMIPQAEYGLKVWPNIDRPIWMLVGHASTGKTVTAFYVAHHLGLTTGKPTVMCHHQCKPDERPSQIIGSQKIRAGATGPETYTFPGILMKCEDMLKVGKYTVVLYLNEVNNWAASNCSIMNSVGDDIHALFNKDTGRRINLDGLKIIMDFNQGYIGTKELNESMKDRAHTTYFPWLPQQTEIDILLSRTGLTPQMAKRVVRLLGALRDAAAGKLSGQSVPLKFVPTLRLALDWAECVEYGMDPMPALASCIYGRIGYEDRYREVRVAIKSVCEGAGFSIPEM